MARCYEVLDAETRDGFVVRQRIVRAESAVEARRRAKASAEATVREVACDAGLRGTPAQHAADHRDRAKLLRDFLADARRAVVRGNCRMAVVQLRAAAEAHGAMMAHVEDLPPSVQKRTFRLHRAIERVESRLLDKCVRTRARKRR